MLLPICIVAASAQNTGAIEGKVLNVAAGTYLRNAQIKVEGTTFETFTNENGEYRLSNLPVGNVTLMASFPTMQAKTAIVTIPTGSTVQQDFNLLFSTRGPEEAAGKTLVLDVFTVSERAMSAEASAVEEKRRAANIKNVVTFEEFGDLGEGNPGEFIKFVPGVEINLAPAVALSASIRGMPPSGTLMMVDGAEFASSAADQRGADLFGANIVNIDRIEISKVPTPDMPANAVGGSINIISKSNLSLRRRELTYNIFGTLTSIHSYAKLGEDFGDRQGTNYKTINSRLTQPGFDFTYMLPVTKSLALSLSAGSNTRIETRDFYGATWNRITNIQTNSSINGVTIPRHRRVLSGSADFRVNTKHRFSVRLQYTDDTAYSYLPSMPLAYGAGATGGELFTQGAPTAVGVATQQIVQYNQYKKTLTAICAITTMAPFGKPI